MEKGKQTANRHTMPVQDPHERQKNFREVALGYDGETAREEALRCLGCKGAPCTKGCPVAVDIPAFLAEAAHGNFEKAYKILREDNALPAVCGRVCPQEKQCEAQCTRGRVDAPVAIGNVERFLADLHAASGENPPSPPKNGRRVAVVGSGPAGLACAGELARRGYEVTVYEALHAAGGVLVYGIPAFRLPKEVVGREIEELEALGVRFVLNAVGGKSFTVEELRTDLGYEAVFLGTGAGLPRFMGIEGENAVGVFSANEYLTRINLMGAYEEGAATPVYRAKKVAVVGGGNVAMDAARCARRLGAEVTVVYRRSEEELPARREEVVHAREEGILFRFLANPVKIETESGHVSGLLCAEMELGEPDASGRRSPRERAGSRFVLAADAVIMALGTSPNPLLSRATEGLALGPRGEIVADGEGRTSLEGVFAGGDAVTGSATVIQAMGAGKRAAAAIDRYLQNKGPVA